MKSYLTTIFNDIREGRNVDVYLTIVVCSGILIASILGVASNSIISSAILATLLLVALNTLNSRRTDENTKKILADFADSQNIITSLKFFREWDDNLFKQKLITAKEISTFVVANYNMFSKNSEDLKEFVRRGGRLRCIYLNPKGHAVKMAADRAFGLERDPNQIIALIVMSLRTISDIAKAAPHADSVQVRFIDHLPSSIMTIINHQDRDGVMFITLNGFNVNLSVRPSFLLDKATDGKWFTFFLATFENIWSESEIVSLSDHFVYNSEHSFQN